MINGKIKNWISKKCDKITPANPPVNNQMPEKYWFFASL